MFEHYHKEHKEHKKRFVIFIISQKETLCLWALGGKIYSGKAYKTLPPPKTVVF